MENVEYLQAPVDGKEPRRVVVLNYTDLVQPNVDLSAAIEEAYGFNGLGILAVRGVPNFTQLRGELLPLIHKFATQPEEVKKKTEHLESSYSFGWSHGKEVLEGKPDFSKGSYYNNPVFDRPFDDEELIKKYPSFCHPNIWPEGMPEFRDGFMNMGKLLVDVGLLIAKQCDIFVKKQCPAFEEGKLERIVRESRTAKGRALHYFPIEEFTSEECGEKSCQSNHDADVSSWCGWHNDHGSLTGLVPAMYMSKEGVEVTNPDSSSGLYIRARNGDLVKAVIPSEYMVFQIGETACIHSGGYLQATPHCVRGAAGEKARGVSRETMAVFMEPMWDEPMTVPTGVEPDMATRGSGAQHLPKGVPPLATRWNEKQDFGSFTTSTLSSYY